MDADFQYMNVEQAAAHIGVTPGRVRQMLLAKPPLIRGRKLNGRAWAIPYLEAERVRKAERSASGRPRSGDRRKRQNHNI